MLMTDILYIEDDTVFDDDLNDNGVEIHSSTLGQDFDDIGWEPTVADDDSPDMENDVYGFYD